VRTHPETGKKSLFVGAFTTHFTNFHNANNVRVGQDCRPGASQLLQCLISQAFIPEYQLRWALEPERGGDLGQPLHPALRSDGLPALPGGQANRGAAGDARCTA
jgi:hypothetical protein